MVTVVLLAYALAAGSVGVRLLRGRQFFYRAPRLGLLAWAALSLSIPVAFLAASMTLLTATAAGHSVADLFHACILMLRGAFADPLPPWGAGLASLALGLATMGVPARLAMALARDTRVCSRLRRQLTMVAAHRDVDRDLVVVEHAQLFAFCLPGRAPTIVLSTGAVAGLSSDELTAVMTHERAHITGRHHLILAWSRALAEALPFLPDLHTLVREQARLVEMAADDRAVEASSVPAVTGALLRLVGVPLPGLSLGAAADRVHDRIERLSSTAPHRGARAHSLLLVAAAVLVVAAPLGLISTAWVAAANAGHCPIS